MTDSPKFETKADPLEASFDAVLMAEDVARQGDEIKSLRTDVDGLKVQMSDISKASARPALTGNIDGAKGMPPSAAAQDFVAKYLRRGDQAGVELKSFSGASGPEGGFAVPQEIDALIGAMLKDISPIRSIATVVQTGTAGYRKLVTTGGTPSGWVSETAGRPETDTPDFNEIAPPSGELYANPAASQAMLDDAAFDVESWLADEIAREFAQAEGAAFVGGSGVNQPRGFLNATVTDESDDVRAFGSLQYVPSGASGSFDSEDVLVDLVHTLRPAYRQGASFVMNSSTLAHIRKFKTADGAFLWQPSLASGQPATLLGYPVVEAEDMPDIAADSLSIAFGNFRAGYLIAERSATSILRDPFTNKPFVHFYATKRVGGQIMNSEAIKLMQFSAS
ncbi:phage major capsid protein [Sphingorhabdus sp. 109]|jgi:HK97 family phage major capsid protein|uniref:phage major capsid protein n=1 Tax=Sphingorhabdus sp. 109 TaxID=2653173 RepID=UPI0012F0C197|nr:phage major capsid protein [Sphingorhabdus sp. 109]VWX61273.1 Phage major capsid protein [Sphingorhabdus sp. 109]